MFSLNLEFLKSGIEKKSSLPEISTLTKESKLALPLERTALEQINYTKWYYSDKSKKLISIIRESYLNDSRNSYLKLNVTENSFVVTKPIGLASDEFYFLFDFVKDKVLGRGFDLRDAVQEAISNDTSYLEFEIFYLHNPQTHQYVTLEIRSYKGSPINITGHCTFANDSLVPLSESKFVECVKEIFNL